MPDFDQDPFQDATVARSPDQAVEETRPAQQQQAAARDEDTAMAQSVTPRDSVPDITTTASSSPPSSPPPSSRHDDARSDNDSDNDRRDQTLARHEEQMTGVDPNQITATAALTNKMDSDNDATHKLLVFEQEAVLGAAAEEYMAVINDDSRPISDAAESAQKYLQAQAALNQLKNPGAEEERMLVQLAEESSETAGIAFPYRAAGTIPELSEERMQASENWLDAFINGEVPQQLVPGTIGNVLMLKGSGYASDVLLSKLPPVIKELGEIGFATYAGRIPAPTIREVTDAGFEAMGGEIAREMPGYDETFTRENLWGQLAINSAVSSVAGMTASNVVKAVGLSLLGISTGPVGLTALLVGSTAASKAFVAADNAQDKLWDDINRTTAENIAADLGISIDDEPLPLTDAQEAELVMFYHRQQPSTSSESSPVETESPVSTEEVLPETVEVASYQPATPADTDSVTTDEAPMSDDVMALINSLLGSADSDGDVIVFADSKDNDNQSFTPTALHDCDVTGSQGMALLEDLMEGRIQFADAPPEVQYVVDSIQDAGIDLVDADGELLVYLADPFVQELVDSGELSEHGQFCVPANDPEPVADMFTFYEIA